MSNSSNKDFYAVADRFIDLANELVAEWGVPRVSAALLFAASRFNAHTYEFLGSESQTREEAEEYFCRQYANMLRDNLDDLLVEEGSET